MDLAFFSVFKETLFVSLMMCVSLPTIAFLGYKVMMFFINKEIERDSELEHKSL